MHIAITGNIGAGKTTLAQLLADQYGWDVLYEAVEGNPYLADFYEDMERWAFNLQIYFLNSRFEQLKIIRNQLGDDPAARRAARSVVQDRTIYEDAYIFAQNLANSGTMAPRDYQTYRTLFENMLSLVQPPDLMIYLRASLPKLREQIRARGRSYEQTIPDDYLLRLNHLYEDFATTYAAGELLVLDVDALDYANNPADRTAILAQIDEVLGRLPSTGPGNRT